MSNQINDVITFIITYKGFVIFLIIQVFFL